MTDNRADAIPVTADHRQICHWCRTPIGIDRSDNRIEHDTAGRKREWHNECWPLEVRWREDHPSVTGSKGLDEEGLCPGCKARLLQGEELWKSPAGEIWHATCFRSQFKDNVEGKRQRITFEVELDPDDPDLVDAVYGLFELPRQFAAHGATVSFNVEPA